MNVLTTALIARGILKTKRRLFDIYGNISSQARYHAYYNLIIRLAIETGLVYDVVLIAELMAFCDPRSPNLLILTRLQGGLMVRGFRCHHHQQSNRNIAVYSDRELFRMRSSSCQPLGGWRALKRSLSLLQTWWLAQRIAPTKPSLLWS